jgi:hypothetical protein
LDLIDFLPEGEGSAIQRTLQDRHVAVNDTLPTCMGTKDGMVDTTHLFAQDDFAEGVAPLDDTPRQGGFGTEGVEMARVHSTATWC